MNPSLSILLLIEPTVALALALISFSAETLTRIVRVVVSMIVNKKSGIVNPPRMSVQFAFSFSTRKVPKNSISRPSAVFARLLFMAVHQLAW